VKIINKPVLKQSKEVDRLPTIDFMRHVSMFFVFYCHFLINWRADNWVAWINLQWTFLDFLGITSFTGLSVLGNMLSYYKRREKGDTRLFTPGSWVRALCLFGIAVIMNLVPQGFMGPIAMLAGNVLTIIAIFSLLTPLVLRLNWKLRTVLLAVLLIVYYPLLTWAWGGLVDAGITSLHILPNHISDPRVFVYYVLFDHRMQAPLLTWLPIVLLVSIVFDRFVKTQDKVPKARLSKELNRICLIGIIIVVASIIVGSTIFPPSKGYVPEELENMTNPGFIWHWPVDWLPIYLVRNALNMVVYNFGLFCITFWFFGQIQLVRGKRFPAQEKLMNFGKLSLTGFLLSHIPYVYQLQMPFWLFYLIYIPLYIFIVEAFWLWTTRLKGVGTIEWGILVASAMVTKAVEHKSKTGKLRSTGTKTAL